MTKDDIPQSWRDLLTQFQVGYKQAILAGGAMRDLWCGNTVKDLDFFVHGDNGPHEWVKGMHEEQSNFDYEGMKYVLGVQTFSGGPLPINIIHCEPWDDVKDLLKTFDFGINQIAFDGENVITTPEFHWDYKHSLFTLYHGDRHDRSLARFQRINLRYGWEMVLAAGVVVPVSKPEEELPF